jgi:hypothetical protein
VLASQPLSGSPVFFAKHQLNYLADIVRILHYTGKRFNFYDVSTRNVSLPNHPVMGDPERL